MYDVNIGRWLETDSERYIDGPDMYQMERSNTVDHLDPLGFAAEKGDDQQFVIHDPDDPTSVQGNAKLQLTGSNLCKPDNHGKIHLRVDVHSNNGVHGNPGDTGWLVINGQRVDVSPSDPGSVSDFIGDWSTDAGSGEGDHSGDITVVFVLASKAVDGNSGGFMSLKVHWSYTCNCGTPTPISKTVTRVDDNRNTNLPTTMPTTSPSTQPANGE